MNFFRRRESPKEEPASAVQNIRTVCPYCGVGCGMVLSVERGRITRVIGDKKHPANFGRLCAKGFAAAKPLNAPDRLAFAHARATRAASPARVSMDDAIAQTAARLRAVIDRHGPDAAALYVSGQISMEAQYLAGKLCKGFLGTNNIDSNSRLCMSSAASGYKLSLGADGPPGSYQDIERADGFLVIGSNMAECHPVLFLRVLDRRKVGARLIVVDPRRTPTAEKADLFLQIKPGTDLALLNGLLHLLIKAGRVDHGFIDKHTEGWDELRAFLEDHTPARVEALTGLRQEDIRLAAKWIGEAPDFTTFWTMGLNQSTHGTWHTNAICNLHLATGKICRPGSGPFSLTGQPNAMGGREVGYLSHTRPGQRSIASAQDRAFIENLWGLPQGAIRAESGLDAVALFQKMETGEVKAVWIIGANPVASMPRRQRVVEALKKAELIIVQDAYHPTETSRYADILLPGALWSEAEGTMVNSERTVTLMPCAVAPPGEARPDWQILTEAARQLGFGNAFPYQSAGDVFNEIRQAWNPATGYDLRGMSYEKLRGRPTQWPCPPNVEYGAPIRYLTDGGRGTSTSVSFPTESGKARFFARPCLPPDDVPNPDFPFALMTGRVAHQWHTLTKTGKVPSLNKLNPGPFLEINPEDAAVLGASDGALVKVRSRRGFAIYPALVTARVRPGDCFAPFHWNDLFGENLAVNAATSEAVDAISRQPELKFSAVTLSLVAPELGNGFTPVQMEYLQTLLPEISRSWRGAGDSPLRLPEDAPFSENQREHVNKLLAAGRRASS